MVDCIDYNCFDELGVYHENDCGNEFVGDFNQAVLFYCGHTTTDYSNGTQILADIAAGLAKLITGALFDIDAPQPQQADSEVPCKPQTITEIKRSGDYKNPNVNTDNDAFHDVLFSGKVFGAMLLYECTSNANGDAQVKLINTPLSFSGGLEAKVKAKQGYRGKYNWSSFTNPQTIATPAGVF
jgi:hypothetical protein